jgi:hypothetical protein
MTQSLPTDEEFLDSLWEPPGKSRNPTDDPKFLEEASGLFREKNVFPEGTDAEQVVRDMFDSSKRFRGFYADEMRKRAAGYLTEKEAYLANIPLGHMQIDSLNGFAVPTPRGGAVIVINLGVILHTIMLSRCTLALTTWGSPHPYCRDHDPFAYIHAILCLAHFTLTSDEKFLEKIGVWNCPSLDSWDLKSAQLGTLAQDFLLLHEYGHIASGHLSSVTDTPKGSELVHSQSHAEEFEADNFAFKHLVAKLGIEAAGVPAVLVFRFLDLIEHIKYNAPHPSDLHPASRDRWLRLREKFAIADGKQPSGSIELMFDRILSYRHDIRI